MRRRLAVWLVPVVALAACADAQEPTDDGGVTVDVPDDWRRTDPENTADVLEARRWQPPDDEVSSLQVIAGCGPETTADDLLAGAALGERPLPVVGAEGQPQQVDVEGLEDARTVVFTLGLDEDDVRARMAGLYGVGDDVLVLVELLRPSARFDPGEAEEVLGSVRVDTGELAARCDDEGGDDG